MKSTPKLLLLLFMMGHACLAQNFQSPESFLGYSIGEKFSFHSRITDYVKYVANENPKQTKLISYGQTNEGRPLQVIIVGNEANIANLESIRTNNLKGIGLADGTATAEIPAIAWLSYNVHGNEAVSSESVMVVLYELLNKQNAVTQDILKNTVVILDPCINPDGRDRYANWYNRYVGTQPDLNAASVEHHEPWPGGRFNHYLFDLNRDWAWQTQVESQQRMKLYHEWMPHLHADFHEMGANSTYYFPPSAKPFHEDLTIWQRDFQNLLGEYNKKRFDKNGWLYFTKESYDLLYPSYGDTYPSYNGAIGMTFEQGGSGSAGLAFAREDGDTLTLKDRIAHHVATSMGTLEAISANKQDVVTNFRKYFNEASSNGVGKYKSYVIKTEGNEEAVIALKKTLDGIQIKYGFTDSRRKLSGFDYSTRKDGSFDVQETDLIISVKQPKGKLVKILFEPETVLEDSNTYDITTWSLPYAYGLKAFATSSDLSVGSKDAAERMKMEVPAQTPYAYLVDNNSFQDTQLLAHLLKNKVKVRFNEKPFSTASKSYKSGALLITKKGNEALGNRFNELVVEAANKFGSEVEVVNSGLVSSGSDIGAYSVEFVKAPKVGILIGEGISPTAAGEVWHYFEQQVNYPATIIDVAYFSKINLWDFDVLILPSGRYGSTISSTEEVKRWLSDGGKLIALENSNSLFADSKGFGLKSKTGKDKPNKLLKYGNQEREGISAQIPGAIYKINVDATHPLGYGYDNGYYAILKSSNAYEYLEKGWNVGTISTDSYVTGFAGSKAKEQMKESLLFGVESIGKGNVVYMIDNPIFRGFWYGGKQLFGNAVFMVK
jgi:hypothetical protein